MKSWKTTLGGVLAGAGLLFADQFPQWSKWGLFIASLGTLLTGLAARDHNVTSEQSGLIPTAVPPTPAAAVTNPVPETKG